MKKIFIQIIISAVMMLLLPYLAVRFVHGDGAMAACFMLFYVINPIYCVIAGAFAGQNIKNSWFLPACTAALFWMGTGLFFTIEEPAFIMYAVIYLFLGIISMMITALFCKKA